MTGYGRSQAEFNGKVITVEIRSLNSKQLDISFRAPSIYREKEIDIRALVGQKLERGKIDVSINAESKVDNPGMTLNKNLAMQYYAQLKELADAMPGAGDTDMLSILVRMPDVMKAEKEEFTPEEWEIINASVLSALADADRFRAAEGALLEQDFRKRITIILSLLEQVQPFEKERIAAIRAKFETQLEDMFRDSNFDRNRFEQELIFYFEKLDITEEKVRLRKHCDYFTETLSDSDSPGKKLGFITQEIGREVNTLGSKANDARIQKIVVQMKDELEKIKEQLANIL